VGPCGGARLLLAGLGALAACAPPGGPAGGVLHLDLRLAGGRSPAAALQEALPVVELRPDARDPASLGPFEVAGGRLGASEAGTFLASLGAEPAALRRTAALDAGEYPELELVLAVRKPTQAAIEWRGAAGEGRLALEVSAGEEPRVLRFRLADSPAWTGAIEELRVIPNAHAEEATLLLAVRLVPRGFRFGDEPLEPGDPEASGDAGLRHAGFEARRAWPADLGVPLFAQVERVPRGGVLATAVARGNRALQPGGAPPAPLRAVVDGRAPDGGWTRLAELELPADPAPRWTPLAVPLAAFAGEALELRFLACTGPAPAPGAAPAEGAPREEHLLWGAPEVQGEPPASRRPNLVLVTLDTTRADAVGGEYTPFLNRFSEDALVFTDAWSTCNSTSASHASILTGLHVEEHGVLSNRHGLGPEVRTLAEDLRAAGYHTRAAVSVPHVQAGAGFGQGFDVFALAQPGAELDGSFAVRWVERWIEEWRELPDRPFFLWVHLFDPHTPYMPPPEFVEAFTARHGLAAPSKTAEPATIPVYGLPRDPERVPVEKRWRAGVSSLEYARFIYRMDVAYADSLCERMLGALAGAGALEEAALLLVADHGESLGEHHIWFDHAGLYRETLHVPLILRLPGGPHGRVDARVSTIDVTPTLLRLGAAQGGPKAGLDLAAVARGEAQGERPVYFVSTDLHQVGFRDADEHFISTLTGALGYGTELVVEDGVSVPHKLPPIPLGKGFLFDPAADQDLLRDLSDANPAGAVDARARLERWRASLARAQTERRALTEAEEAGLQGLGYAGD